MITHLQSAAGPPSSDRQLRAPPSSVSQLRAPPSSDSQLRAPPSSDSQLRALPSSDSQLWVPEKKTVGKCEVDRQMRCLDIDTPTWWLKTK